MPSFFDSLFGAYGAPSITKAFGDQAAITLIGPDGSTLIEEGPCTLFPVEDLDQYDPQGMMTKESTIVAEVTRDLALTWAGGDEVAEDLLPNVMTSATAIINSREWAVDRVLTWTDNFVRLLLIDHSMKRLTRAGLRRGD